MTSFHGYIHVRVVLSVYPFFDFLWRPIENIRDIDLAAGAGALRRPIEGKQNAYIFEPLSVEDRRWHG
jgi:hypothetical protein